MNEAIAHLKHAVESLQSLEEIFGPSKRTAAGVLDDLSEWLSNANPTYHLLSFRLLEAEEEARRYALGTLAKIDDWHSEIANDNMAHSAHETAKFVREDLEDCILGLQAAIQILEEEEIKKLPF